MTAICGSPACLSLEVNILSGWFYRVENEKKVMIVPPDEVNAEIINATLSDSINQLLNDREPMGFLAGP